jgi:hypothetical protein
MKRSLVLGAAEVGIFVLGGVAGAVFTKDAFLHEFRTRCLALFDDKEIVGMTKMEFMAEGHTDWVYNLTENDATMCITPKDGNHSKEQQPCIARLKAFYDRFPDRKAGLEQRHPDVAKALGYTTSP